MTELLGKEDVALCIFAYRRPHHLSRVLEALDNCENIERVTVKIFIDGPKLSSNHDEVAEVKNVAQKPRNFFVPSVEQSPINQGLSKSIMQGVTRTLKRWPAAIVLEDDVEVSPTFLVHMLDALAAYWNDRNVASISGYLPTGNPSPDMSECEKHWRFVPRSSSWGWATWSSRWRDGRWLQDVSTSSGHRPNARQAYPLNYCGNDIPWMLELNRKGLIDTWAVQWAAYHLRFGYLAAYPPQSLTMNIGLDGSGTHCAVPGWIRKPKSGPANPVIPWTDADYLRASDIICPTEVSCDDALAAEFSKHFKVKTRSRLKWGGKWLHRKFFRKKRSGT